MIWLPLRGENLVVWWGRNLIHGPFCYGVGVCWGLKPDPRPLERAHRHWLEFTFDYKPHRNWEFDQNWRWRPRWHWPMRWSRQ